MAINLPNFPEFDLHPRETIPTRFGKYKKRLDNLFAAMDITDANRKKAMFLHYVGEETSDIIDTLTVPAAPGSFGIPGSFGMSCSAEIFQKRINDVIQGIPGVKNISDDIYIGGIDKEQHDVRLRSVLRRLQENNLTINAKKCEFQVNKMLFFGHVFSGSGISFDPKKIEALQTVSPPKNVTEVRSLLSSASFSSGFIKDFATITRPLRKLTCKDQVWTWEAEQQNSFDQLKTALSKEVTLGYFDPEKKP